MILPRLSESYEETPKDVQAGLDTFFAEPEETSASAIPFEMLSEPESYGVMAMMFLSIE